MSLALKFLALCLLIGTGPAFAAEQNPQQQARQILAATGTDGGLVVHVGCGDGQLTAALKAGDGFLVHGLDVDPKSVDAARQHVRELGEYGSVSIDVLSGSRLPYAENMVNLLVSEDLGKITQSEVLRVLVPKGVAYVKEGGEWTKVVKPWPADMDQWTHFLHGPDNNAVSHDAHVGPPRHIRWKGLPKFARATNNSPVSVPASPPAGECSTSLTKHHEPTFAWSRVGFWSPVTRLMG